SPNLTYASGCRPARASSGSQLAPVPAQADPIRAWRVLPTSGSPGIGGTALGEWPGALHDDLWRERGHAAMAREPGLVRRRAGRAIAPIRSDEMALTRESPSDPAKAGA